MTTLKTTNAKATMKHINIQDSLNGLQNTPTCTFAQAFADKVDAIGKYFDTTVFPKAQSFIRKLFSTIFVWAVLGVLVSILCNYDPAFATEYPLIFEVSQFGLKLLETTLAFGKECCMDLFNFVQNFKLVDLFLFPYKFIVEFIKNLSVFAELF